MELRFRRQSEIFGNYFQMRRERDEDRGLSRPRLILNECSMVTVRKCCDRVPEGRERAATHKLSEFSDCRLPSADLNPKAVAQFVENADRENRLPRVERMPTTPGARNVGIQYLATATPLFELVCGHTR